MPFGCSFKRTHTIKLNTLIVSPPIQIHRIARVAVVIQGLSNGGEWPPSTYLCAAAAEKKNNQRTPLKLASINLALYVSCMIQMYLLKLPRTTKILTMEWIYGHLHGYKMAGVRAICVFKWLSAIPSRTHISLASFTCARFSIQFFQIYHTHIFTFFLSRTFFFFVRLEIQFCTRWCILTSYLIASYLLLLCILTGEAYSQTDTESQHWIMLDKFWHLFECFH